jgi:hypothetical protein
MIHAPVSKPVAVSNPMAGSAPVVVSKPVAVSTPVVSKPVAVSKAVVNYVLKLTGKELLAAIDSNSVIEVVEVS